MKAREGDQEMHSTPAFNEQVVRCQVPGNGTGELLPRFSGSQPDRATFRCSRAAKNVACYCGNNLIIQVKFLS